MQTQQAMITWLSFISAVLLTDRKQCLKVIIRPEGSQSGETDGSVVSFDGFLKSQPLPLHSKINETASEDNV